MGFEPYSADQLRAIFQARSTTGQPSDVMAKIKTEQHIRSVVKESGDCRKMLPLFGEAATPEKTSRAPSSGGGVLSRIAKWPIEQQVLLWALANKSAETAAVTVVEGRYKAIMSQLRANSPYAVKDSVR